MTENERRRFERIKKVIDGRLKGHKAFADPAWTPPRQWKTEDCGEQRLPLVEGEYRRLTSRRVRLKRRGSPSSDYLWPVLRMRPESAYDKEAGGTDFDTAWRHTLCHEITHARGLRTAFGWFWPISYGFIYLAFGGVFLDFLAFKAGFIAELLPSWILLLLAAVLFVLLAILSLARKVEEMVAEMGAVVLAFRVHLIKRIRPYSIDYIAGYERGIPWPLRGIARSFAWWEARRRVSREPTRHPCFIWLIWRFRRLWAWG